jgi:hypothetical protein
MRVVAISADHTGTKHARLREGSPFENLALNLAVRVVFTTFQQQRCMGIQEATAGQRVSNQRAGARMAWGAGFYLCGGGLAWWPDPMRDTARVIFCKAPGTRGAIAQPDGKAAMCVLMARATLSPGDMCRPRPMAAFATDADFRPYCFITVIRCVIAALQTGGMAGCAHEVPGLRTPRPMQRVLRGQRFMGHQVIPALATLFTRPAIPGPGQRLASAIWKQHQILLQRINAEGFGDDEIRLHTILPIGADDVLFTLSPKARGMATIRDRYAGEIAKDIGLGGRGHGAGVITLLPSGGFRCVTGGADCGTDKALSRGLCRAWAAWAGEQGSEQERQRDQHHDADKHNQAALKWRWNSHDRHWVRERITMRDLPMPESVMARPVSSLAPKRDTGRK